jgi:2-polyprenyl-3-methyl-5-hydroxy-6-metoxy-1,4-benzoquinol methylase
VPSIQKAPLYPQALPASYETIECPDEQTAVQLIKLKRRPIIQSKEKNEFACRTWHIHPQLEKLGRCNTACALDLGCGNGRDSVWLACNGWSVTAVDHLPEIQRSIDEFSSRFQVSDRINFVHSNIHEFTTNNRFQLVLLHYTWKVSNLQRALENVEVGGSISVLVHSETH